ncbi:MAG: T9SS type A sorting domain-containing protein [Saprospiraceae bacterium]|nr:T9SS type A sorting domain-containing protein [Saprospiraceae bacterium]
MKRTRHVVFPPLLLFCCLAWAQAVFAQNIGLSVVGSAGDTKQHPDFGTLYWTVGEVAVETLEESPINLTQGFHQVFYILVSEHGPAKPDWALRLFPNPTTELVTLETSYTNDLHVSISSLNGQALYSRKIIGGGSNTFDLKDYPAGTYLFSVRDADQNLQTFKILKIRL